MGRPVLFCFTGGGLLAGPRWARLLEDGSVPSDFRVLLEGEPPAVPKQYKDGQPRLWDVYSRDGSDGLGRPVFRFRSREVTAG